MTAPSAAPIAAPPTAVSANVPTALPQLAAVPIAVHFGAAFTGPADRRGRTDGDDPNGPNRHR